MKLLERIGSRWVLLITVIICILAIINCQTRLETGNQPGDGTPSQDSNQSYQARVDTARLGIKKGFTTMPKFAERDSFLQKVGAAWRYVWPSRKERDFEEWNIPIDWHRIKDIRMRREGQTAPDLVVSERGCSEAIRQLLWSLHEPVRRVEQEFADIELGERESNFN